MTTTIDTAAFDHLVDRATCQDDYENECAYLYDAVDEARRLFARCAEALALDPREPRAAYASGDNARHATIRIQSHRTVALIAETEALPTQLTLRQGEHAVTFSFPSASVTRQFLTGLHQVCGRHLVQPTPVPDWFADQPPIRLRDEPDAF